MPTLNIEGRKVKVGDDFLKLSPAQQNATVEEIAQSLKISAGAGQQPAEAPAEPATDPVGLNEIVRSTATGVPVLGGLANTLNAATAAVAAPAIEPFLTPGPESINQAPGETWVERLQNRYSMAKRIQEAKDAKMARENPILDTGLKITGGVAGTIPAVLAAPKLFGAVGSLPQQVGYGAASGAGLSAADAAVRGEDIPTAVAIGGATSAAAPLVGRAIGAGYRAIKGSGPPVAANTVRVGSVDIPIADYQVSGNLKGAAAAERARTGGLGDRAQAVTQGFDTAQEAAVTRATDEIAAGLDPTGVRAATSPSEAGAKVIDDLVARDAARLASETAQQAGVRQEGAALRGALGGDIFADAAAAPTASEAAEAMAAGVTRARDTQVAARDALYRGVRETPGGFDPSVGSTMSSEIRRRGALGDNPLFVSPDAPTSAANQALRALDETVGGGLFANRAAPVARPGPVAAAARVSETPPPPAAADNTVDLIRQKYGNEAADAYLRQNAANPHLAPHSVATADGSAVDVRPGIVEASSLKTSADDGYNAALQPRNRTRAASDAQINDIATNLNPARLGASAEADRGAPIIGADGMVESGNGRVLAIRQAYAENGPAAARYREWLQSQGVDVSGYREPVLVRERTTPLTDQGRADFAVKANQSSTLSLSAPERALADSRALTPDTLGLIRSPDLGAVENRDFVRQFMNTVPQAERGALMTASGDLSAEGLARVRNAVLAKAYGDSPILARIAESTDDGIRSISTALTQAAPEWAAMRAAAADGRIPAGLDITDDLVDAVSRTARIRGKGIGLDEAAAQVDAFNAQSPGSAALQRMFYSADGKSAAPSSQIANAVRNYAQQASKVDAAPGLGLGLPAVTAKDILETTAAKVGAPKQLAKEVTEAATAAAPKAAENILEQAPELTLRQMDNGRKRLVSIYGDARRAALTNGNWADVNAVRRIMHEFDNVIIDAFESGKFSGDSAAARQLMLDARAAHAEYRQTFTPRGPGDTIGRDVEKILGRYADTAATPEQVATLSYGPQSAPGGGRAVMVAQRLRDIVGETSPEWGAYKQGLFSYLTDVPEGLTRTGAKTADRLDKFLAGDLARTVLSADERTALASYSRNLRAADAHPTLDAVEKKIADIAGRNGGIPYSPDMVIGLLLKDKGKGSHLATLTARLQNELSPEGWTSVRQGMWTKITERGGGGQDFGPQALATRIGDFLDSDVAKIMYSDAERKQMAALQKAYKQMVPLKGTTNPSGTAAALAQIAKKTGNNVLAMLGLLSGGVTGAATGFAVEQGAKAVASRRAAQQATQALYGRQAKAPIRTSRVPIVLSQGLSPNLDQRHPAQ